MAGSRVSELKAGMARTKYLTYHLVALAPAQQRHPLLALSPPHVPTTTKSIP